MKTLSELRWSVRQNLRETGQFISEAKTGTVTITADITAPGYVVTGSGTLFLSEYQVGDEIQVNGIIRTIRSITSDTVLNVGVLWGSAAGGVAHYAITRQGGWTDETINDELNSHAAAIQNRLWREARVVLLGSVTANTVAGADIVTLPAAMLSFEVVEYRASTTESYSKIGRLDISQKEDLGIPPWMYPVGAGAQKPTGRPTRFTVVSPTTIELNTYPDVSVSAGLRFYGAQRFSTLALDTDTLGLPEAEGFEHALELMTTAHLLKQESAESARARVYEQDSETALRIAMAPWQAYGRDGAYQSVVDVEG